MFAPVIHAADVDNVRLWRAPDHTRLVLDLSGPVEHKVFRLSNPDRLVVDISAARLKTTFSELSLDDTPIRNIRSAHREDNTLRVVLDLREQVQPRSFFLKKQAGVGDRLVIDLHDREPSTTAQRRAPRPTQNTNDGRRDIIIAVDAGHGGEDPGAIGPGGLFEKNVVMDISERLVERLNAIPGYKAQLIRTGDYYVSLRDRRNIARRMQADLMISVHADAFTHPSANGASVFALSRRGATSESARFLAQRENEADLIGGVGSVSLDDKDELLAGVLVDLSMTATLSTSLEVGSKVLNSMGGIARLHKPTVEQAGFAVLMSPDVPSILVETGFISNPSEAAKLATVSYRRQMAATLAQGIESYFNSNPPDGTLLAWRQRNGGSEQEYVIARGDTLSEIARRYDVSVRDILQANGLSDHRIRVGQTLRIPSSS
ncbi:N-acetylmuramoyl-L-alanine amidase [Marinimicrobium sp. ABcell2]|uniref:N-acetylmuramoyl-L-alanine amidase n=1 Tax=Marinimicrobium sp. ABcell2 TaxID=3069751 RepID=UPI0027B54CB6|nr:N-acetylmuramoyl-L-alanine amidase [Marinimicrobium sp. ABcell2]MDQ2076372.1 N-acetylmuramoyl-L-alanine amidase [Marinimicrobium sp. ABcell2]